MGVGVIEAVSKDHLQIHIGPAPSQVVEVEPGLTQGFDIFGADSYQHLHGEDATAAIVGINLWKVNAGILFEIPCELLQIPAFEGEIKLIEQDAAKLPNRGHRLIGAKSGHMLLQQLRQPGGDIQVLDDSLLDAGMLDFDDHGLTAQQSCPMHLPNRCRGQGAIVEFQKYLFHRLSQLGSDRGSDRFRRVGRSIGPKLAQLLSSARAGPIRSGRVLRI